MFTATSRRRKLAALFAASALLLTVGGFAAPASADETSIGTPHGNIQTTAPGSIIVHKRVLGGTGVAAPDSGAATNLGAPLAGVVFKVTKVSGVDLASNVGWTFVQQADNEALIKELTAGRSYSFGGTTVSAGTATNATTNAAGTATFSFPVALGLYLVEEVAAPGTVVDRAEPFLVTLPYPYTTGAGTSTTSKWLYDVNVFPKNVLSSVDKSVQIQGDGNVVKFDLTTQTVAKDDPHYTYFGLYDTLDARLDAASATITGTLAGTAFVAADFVATKTGQEIKIELTNLGLAKLDRAAVGAEVKFTISVPVTTVALAGKTSGVIENTAEFKIRTGKDIPPTGVPPVPPGTPGITPKVDTKWGSFTATKVDSADITKPLAGAKFALFEGTYVAAVMDGANVVTPATCQPVGALSSYDVANALGQATSASNGTFGFDLLFVGSSAEPRDFNCYVLVETEAPAGFTKLTAPISLQIKAGENTTFYDVNSPNNGKVLNPKSEVGGDISLPLTGAAGQILMTLGGIALLAIALGMIIVRRKQIAEASAN